MRNINSLCEHNKIVLDAKGPFLPENLHQNKKVIINSATKRNPAVGQLVTMLQKATFSQKYI